MYLTYRRFFFRVSIICCPSTILMQSSAWSCNQNLEMDKKVAKLDVDGKLAICAISKCRINLSFHFNVICNDWMYLERKKFLKITFYSSFIRKWKFAFLPCVPSGFIVFRRYTLKMAWYIISSREGEWQLIPVRRKMY